MLLLLCILISAVHSDSQSEFDANNCDQSKCTSSAYAGTQADPGSDCLAAGAEAMSCADDFEGVETGHSEWEYGIYWKQYTCCPNAKMLCALTVIDKDGGPSVSVSWPSAETVYSDTAYDTTDTVYFSENDTGNQEYFLDSCDVRCGSLPVTLYHRTEIVTFYDVKKAALSALGKDLELAAYTDLLHYFAGSPDDYHDQPSTTSWNDFGDDWDSFRRLIDDNGAYMHIDGTRDSQIVQPADLCDDAGYIVVDSNARRSKVSEYELTDPSMTGDAAAPGDWADTRKEFETTCITGDFVMTIGPFTVNADFTGYALEFRKHLTDQLNEDYAEDIRAQYCSGSDVFGGSDCIESIDAVSYSNRDGEVDDDYDIMLSMYDVPGGFTPQVNCLVAVHFKRPDTTAPAPELHDFTEWVIDENGAATPKISWARAPPLNGILTATDPEGTAQLNAFWMYGIAALLAVLVTVNVTCLAMHGRCNKKQYESADYDSDV